MNYDQEISRLEKELQELKASNRSLWDTYGSELCAGDMIRQEEKIEEQITRLKREKIIIELTSEQDE